MPARVSHRVVLVVGALALMLSLLPAVASAGAIADTQIVDTHTCTTDAFFTLCVDEHTVLQRTFTPTGRTLGNAETRVDATATGVPGSAFDGCVSGGGVNFGGHFTDINDINLSGFTRLRGTSSLACGGVLFLDCTNTLHFQFVDGRFVMDRSTDVCAPV
jgi:hypothetical protein